MSRSVSLATLTAAAALLLAAPTAGAQTPRTLTATGLGQAEVTPTDRQEEASIRAAVDEANAQALPRAIAQARARAAALATATGVALGALVSVADGVQPPFGPFYGVEGTFGPGRFCGQVRNTKVVVRNGRRQRVRTKGTHKVCRAPRVVYAGVTLTFAIS